MTENNLIPFAQPVNFVIDVEDYQSSNFIPQIKTIQGLSPEMNEHHKEYIAGAKIGDYVFNKKILPRPVPIAVIGVRHHAIEFKDGAKKAESFNRESPIYRGLVADARNNNNINYGCEFLIYLPTIGAFACLYLGKYNNRDLSLELMVFTTPQNQRADMPRPQGWDKKLEEYPETRLFNLITGKCRRKTKHNIASPYVIPITKAELPPDLVLPNETQVNENLEIFMAPVTAEVIPVRDTGVAMDR